MCAWFDDDREDYELCQALQALLLANQDEYAKELAFGEGWTLTVWTLRENRSGRVQNLYIITKLGRKVFYRILRNEIVQRTDHDVICPPVGML